MKSVKTFFRLSPSKAKSNEADESDPLGGQTTNRLAKVRSNGKKNHESLDRQSIQLERCLSDATTEVYYDGRRSVSLSPRSPSTRPARLSSSSMLLFSFPLTEGLKFQYKEEVEQRTSEEELQVVLEEFQNNYEQFAEKYGLVRVKDADFTHAIKAADVEENIRGSARSFEKEIGAVLNILQEKQHARPAKWTGKLLKFVTKLYPLAKTCLQLTSRISQVKYLKCFNNY